MDYICYLNVAHICFNNCLGKDKYFRLCFGSYLTFKDLTDISPVSLYFPSWQLQSYKLKMDHSQRDSWQFPTNVQLLLKLCFKLKCCISHLQIRLCCQQPFTISLNLWSRIESILISDSRNAVWIAESRRWREPAEEEQRREASSQEGRFGHAMVSNSDFDGNRKWFGGVFL